ncbi:MAG: SHOCT domain-containing protein [Erythrobacter sp.]|nr:SHOCT domain-containing protein [Erythrobacter sp.]
MGRFVPLGGCLFTGFLMVCGLGLLGLLAIPSVGEAMGPLVCESEQTMVSETQSYHLPGENGEEVFYFCQDASGKREQVGMGALLGWGLVVYAGFGLVVVWPLVTLFMFRARRRAAALFPAGGLEGLASRIRVQTRQQHGWQSPPPAPPAPRSGDSPAERLRALDSLHAEGLITDSEYAAKKAEILREL